MGNGLLARCGYRCDLCLAYKLDSTDESGWAVAFERQTRGESSTIAMFLSVLLKLFVSVAAVLGLLKGKRMRTIILRGLLRMSEDKKVAMYSDESLLRGYSIRYYIFISVVGFLGALSIAVPLILQYA